MPDLRSKQNSKQGEEYCGGYTDKHGIWNNGFLCPKWGGPFRDYCCGDERERFCCPREYPVAEDPLTKQVPLITGLCVGVLVLITTSFILACYFCQCCWIYKRRKLGSNGGYSMGLRPSSRAMNYAVNYSVCPHQTILHDGRSPPYVFPLDSPPPYPGGPSSSTRDKEVMQMMDLSQVDEAVVLPDEASDANVIRNPHVNTLSDVPSTSSLILSTPQPHSLVMGTWKSSGSPIASRPVVTYGSAPVLVDIDLKSKLKISPKRPSSNTDSVPVIDDEPLAAEGITLPVHPMGLTIRNVESFNRMSCPHPPNSAHITSLEYFCKHSHGTDHTLATCHCPKEENKGSGPATVDDAGSRTDPSTENNLL